MIFHRVDLGGGGLELVQLVRVLDEVGVGAVGEGVGVHFGYFFWFQNIFLMREVFDAFETGETER